MHLSPSPKDRRRIRLAISIALALGIPCWPAISHAAGGFNADMYGMPGQVVGYAHNTMPMATPDMLTGLGNWVGSQIQQAAQTLNAAQIKQSEIDTKLVDAANNARAQTAMQVADGQIQARLALAQPTDGNGVNLRLANSCGTAAAAAGLAAGAAANITAAGAISGVLRTYNSNTANLNQQQYVYALAKASPRSLVANNVIGDPAGAGVASQSYSPQDVNRFIQITTNPTPLNNLPPSAVNTPAGQRYEAIQNLQKAILDIPQETLNGVAQMNAPTLPMRSWLSAQLDSMSAPPTLLQALSQASTVPLATPSAAAQKQQSILQRVSTATVCVLGAVFSSKGTLEGCLSTGNPSSTQDGANNISLQTFLYMMVQGRVANQNWWTSLSKMNSAPPLLQEIAEIDALRAAMDYQNMVNISRMASMQAQQMSSQMNANIEAQANAVRKTAITQAGH
ncbi:MAG: hypothetical protein HKL99_10745 [Burkholderiales bacterium]|nr:hypothetical protein [Burkholderiales bacterium]